MTPAAFNPPVVPNIPGAILQGRLPLQPRAPRARVSQEGILVVGQATPKIRVSQEGVVVVGQATPKIRVSQEGVVVVGQAVPNIRVSQEGILVIAMARIKYSMPSAYSPAIPNTPGSTLAGGLPQTGIQSGVKTNAAIMLAHF